MHLQQTKVESRTSGGPQYYFHNLPVSVKEFIRGHGACPVVLQTPYGIASSSFMAVGRDHKLGRKGKVVRGNVGHDRIQAATGDESIGEAIRFWYALKAKHDFERVEVEVVIHPVGHFILVPTAVLMRGSKRPKTLEKVAPHWPFIVTIKASSGKPRSRRDAESVQGMSPGLESRSRASCKNTVT